MGIYGPCQLCLGGKVRLCYLPGTHSVDGLAARPFLGVLHPEDRLKLKLMLSKHLSALTSTVAPEQK